jgi:hypothetical protein
MGIIENTPSEDFETIKAELIESGNAPAAKEKRPYTKRVKDVPIPVFIESDSIQKIVGFAFDVIAKRKGKHWELSDDEKETLGALSSKVLNKRSPDWLKAYGDEIALVGFAIAVIIPRVITDIEMEKDKLKPSEEILQ